MSFQKIRNQKFKVSFRGRCVAKLTNSRDIRLLLLTQTLARSVSSRFLAKCNRIFTKNILELIIRLAPVLPVDQPQEFRFTIKDRYLFVLAGSCYMCHKPVFNRYHLERHSLHDYCLFQVHISMNLFLYTLNLLRS